MHCIIENCQWWAEPDLCIAEKLLVVSDELARELPGEIDVEQTNQIVEEKGLSTITECYQSCCKTFVPRDVYLAGKA